MTIRISRVASVVLLSGGGAAGAQGTTLLGRLYRRFPIRGSLIATLVKGRVQSFVAIARAAEEVADPFEAMVAVTRGSAEADDGDATFQLA